MTTFRAKASFGETLPLFGKMSEISLPETGRPPKQKLGLLPNEVQATGIKGIYRVNPVDSCGQGPFFVNATSFADALSKVSNRHLVSSVVDYRGVCKSYRGERRMEYPRD